MEQRQLGNRGPDVSVLGLGCNNFGMKLDKASSIAVVHAALDAGITHLDTAEMYGQGKSEEFIGEALRGRRDDAVIATKFTPRPKDQDYTPGILRQRIVDACEASLRRLQTDHIDLYYQHYPDADGAAVEEALEALDTLVASGKIAHLASSNVSADQIRNNAAIAAQHELTAMCATQEEWSLLNRTIEDQIVPEATEVGLGIVPYFPLASGLLTGKYRKGQPFPEGSRLEAMPYFAQGLTDDKWDRLEALISFAADHGRTITELAFGWLLGKPSVASVIAGATSPEQVGANAAAVDWRLSSEQLATVNEILAGG